MGRTEGKGREGGRGREGRMMGRKKKRRRERGRCCTTNIIELQFQNNSHFSINVLHPNHKKYNCGITIAGKML